jgi:hypothetical protein
VFEFIAHLIMAAFDGLAAFTAGKERRKVRAIRKRGTPDPS